MLSEELVNNYRRIIDSTFVAPAQQLGPNKLMRTALMFAMAKFADAAMLTILQLEWDEKQVKNAKV